MNRVLLAQKRAEAADRRAARAARSPQEQLERLDSLGMTATRERARLERQMKLPANTHNPETGEKLVKKTTPKKGRQPKGKAAKSHAGQK